MASQSPFKLGLGPKTLGRAKIILGSLLLLFMLFAIAGIYQGVVSGDFDRLLLKPFRDFTNDLDKAINATPAPVPTLTPMPSTSTTSTSTSTSKVIINQTAPVQKSQPAAATCFAKNIREGEFASNKCYSQQDYEDLSYYLNKYNSAVGSVSFYQTKVNISCSNNDFFKTCEQDKKDQQANLDNIPRYRSIIQGIIAKGR